jgi:hypothetical protein
VKNENLIVENNTIVDIAMKHWTLNMLMLDTLQEGLRLKFGQIKPKKHNKAEVHSLSSNSKVDLLQVRNQQEQKPENWKQSSGKPKGSSDNKSRQNIMCYNCNQKRHAKNRNEHKQNVGY